ncbi:MAG: type II toxin-antitoxin system Phd/YefM family antitoxin [Thermodesulfobacteriota bacterium]|nr:type II toxin-antitoxin system Phd/YefM family antitoxin [Thermodesulfobacteriota bacterium]
MQAVPEMIPISELRQKQNQILEKLTQGPVVLTQRGRASAVLVSPNEWNLLVKELENLRDCIDVLESRKDFEPSIDFDEYAKKRKS